jgi:hypothetical protein
MAGVALSVGALAVAATLAVGCAAAGTASSRAVQLSGVADSAALAAADAASGAVTGIPCERAEQMVARAGARLEACVMTDAEATVSVSVPFGPLSFRARARAGPAL